jgi:hypothetical protein
MPTTRRREVIRELDIERHESGVVTNADLEVWAKTQIPNEGRRFRMAAKIELIRIDGNASSDAQFLGSSGNDKRGAREQGDSNEAATRHQELQGRGG